MTTISKADFKDMLYIEINSAIPNIHFSRKDVNAICNVLEKINAECIAEKGGVVIPGVGKIEVYERSARTCSNPQTGELMQVPARNALKLKAQTSIKAAINPEG